MEAIVKILTKINVERSRRKCHQQCLPAILEKEMNLKVRKELFLQQMFKQFISVGKARIKSVIYDSPWSVTFLTVQLPKIINQHMVQNLVQMGEKKARRSYN